jgi:hypothetical protein
MAITLRKNISRPLTHVELDNNFISITNDISSLSASVEDVTTYNAELLDKLSELDMRIKELQAIHINDGSVITVNDPVFNVTPIQEDITLINETDNRSISFIIKTTDSFQTENISWNVSGTGITPEDFSAIVIDGESSDGSLSGTLTNAAMDHVIEFQIAVDEETEGDETLVLNLAIVRNGISYTESREVVITDTNIASSFYTVTYNDVAYPSLYEYITTNSDESLWLEGFNTSDIMLSESDVDEIYTNPLMEAGIVQLTMEMGAYDGIPGITSVEIIDLTIQEVVGYVNNKIDAFFGTSNNVVVGKVGVYESGMYDEATLEFNSLIGGIYIRDSSPTYAAINYQEVYTLSDIENLQNYISDLVLSTIASVTPGFEESTPGSIIMAAWLVFFVETVSPVILDKLSTKITTVDLYGFRVINNT